MKEIVLKGLRTLIKYIKPYKITVYVLIGYDSTKEDDHYRVEKLRKLGVNPYVMPYRKSDPYQKSFARYVNHKAIFKSITYKEYCK